MAIEKVGGPAQVMGILDFIASVIGSVAWPVAAVTIALVFRTQLRGLMERIKRLSLGENSVDFSEKLDVAEANAEVSSALPDANFIPPLPSQNTIDDNTALLISAAPSVAILDMWARVERKVIRLGKEVPDFITGNSQARPFRLALESLVKAGRISPVTYEKLLELRALRNTAAHTDEISAADAFRFFDLAKSALFFLDGPDVKPDTPEGERTILP